MEAANLAALVALGGLEDSKFSLALLGESTLSDSEASSEWSYPRFLANVIRATCQNKAGDAEGALRTLEAAIAGAQPTDAASNLAFAAALKQRALASLNLPEPQNESAARDFAFAAQVVRRPTVKAAYPKEACTSMAKRLERRAEKARASAPVASTAESAKAASTSAASARPAASAPAVASAPAASSTPAASSAPAVATPPVAAPSPAIPAGPKRDWYQSLSHVYVSYAFKNADPDATKVEYSESKVDVSSVDKKGTSFQAQVLLNSAIVPSECSYTVSPFKIEIKLSKATQNVNWSALESTEAAAVAQAIQPAASSVRVSAYASKRDWSKIEKEAEKELAKDKPTGEEALNELFASIYSKADDDTKRAMKKSFQTSGGTVLTTNWKEAKKKDYESEKRPPKGSVWKSWEGDVIARHEDDDPEYQAKQKEKEARRGNKPKISFGKDKGDGSGSSDEEED